MSMETSARSASTYKTGGTAVAVTVTGGAVERAERLLAGIPGGVQKAAQRAVRRASATVQSASAREIRKVYAVSQANLRTEKNVRARYSYRAGQISAVIHYSGKRIPLYRYDGISPLHPVVQDKKVPVNCGGTWLMMHPGVPVSAHQRKDTRPVTFFNAFVAQMESSHIGIFERTGGIASTGFPKIRELMGKSYPEMAGNREVLEALSQKGFESFEKNLEHETNAILNGWAGV